MLASWKVAPALAWGNTVVLKPAEDTPASATIMARLALEAGLPPGVLNVLHGYGPNSAGAALTEHPAVDRITFTGESATGRVIARAAAANLKDPATQLGPLASQEHYKKVRSYLDGIEPDGGTIRTGDPGDGWVILPTIVENAPPTARVCREEVFGPVVTVTPFDTDSEAIGQANDTPYGLNAMVLTENLSRAHRASAALKAGTVWVNCFFIRDLRAPFGGVGDSGIGREGGNFSREFFTEPKAVVMQV